MVRSIKNHPKKLKEATSDVESRGVLIGAGFIAGESILSVSLAVLIVLNINLNEKLGIHELSQTFSLLSLHGSLAFSFG